jgi:hypothetical protein
VIVAPSADQNEALRAIVAERTLRCDQINMADLTKFRDDWLARLRQQTREGRGLMRRARSTVGAESPASR